jgi:hypothetical protein
MRRPNNSGRPAGNEFPNITLCISANLNGDPSEKYLQLTENQKNVVCGIKIVLFGLHIDPDE